MPTKTSPGPKPKSEKPKQGSARKKRTKPGSKKDWNILFYLIGDGLISSAMISQLKAITDAGFEENTNVLVYFDPNCNGKNARIFEVNAQRKEDYFLQTGKKTIIGDGLNSFVRDIAEDCHIASLPQIPAEITLRYFLEYARAYYPAKNYLLFLMGHGVIVGNDAFLPDPDDNSAITLPDLGWILTTFADKVRADGDEFPLVGFHSCSMSSAELVFELAGSAKYMIGTQGAAFPGSWPYRQLLKKIFIAIDKSKRPKGADKEVVGTILEGIQNLSFYNSEDFWLAGFSSDISLCSLNPEKVKRLKEPIEELSQALQRGLTDTVTQDSIRLAHLESQSYWQENYTDIFDFCSCLQERCKGATATQTAIRKACEKVTLAINGTTPTKTAKLSQSNGLKSTDFSQKLVVYSDFYGPAYQFSNGLSIYFPWRSPANKVIETYKDYKFTQELASNSWLNFLQKYFRKTQREARSTRTPWRSTPEVSSNLLPFTFKPNLLRTLSEQGILALGPPPAKVGGDLSTVGDGFAKVGRAFVKLGYELSNAAKEMSGKVEVELSKVGGNLSKVGGNLSKVGAELSEKVGGNLSNKVGAELTKVGAELSKVLSDLSKMEGELDKVGAELSSGVGAELSKLFGDVWKVGGDLSKVGGNLSKVGGNLSKVGGNLSKADAELSEKVGGNLSKVGAELSKVGGNLSSNEGSELTKVGAELSKVGGNLGALYGHTVIKNFSSPEYQFVTSRPDRADLNIVESGAAPNRPEVRPTKNPAGKRPNLAKGIKK